MAKQFTSCSRHLTSLMYRKSVPISLSMCSPPSWLFIAEEIESFAAPLDPLLHPHFLYLLSLTLKALQYSCTSTTFSSTFLCHNSLWMLLRWINGIHPVDVQQNLPPFLSPIRRRFLSRTRKGGVTFWCIRKVSKHELRKWRGCRHGEAKGNINRRGGYVYPF
jgi:hypothetical protein